MGLPVIKCILPFDMDDVDNALRHERAIARLGEEIEAHKRFVSYLHNHELHDTWFEQVERRYDACMEHMASEHIFPDERDLDLPKVTLDQPIWRCAPRWMRIEMLNGFGIEHLF